MNKNLNQNFKMPFFPNRTKMNKNKHLNRLFYAQMSCLISIYLIIFSAKFKRSLILWKKTSNSN